MERKFTGFLIPILIVTMLYLLFVQPDDREKDEAQAPTTVADPDLQDPAVQDQIRKQPPHELDDSIKIVKFTFGAVPTADSPGHGFQVTFSRYGAGIRYVLLNDHFDTPKASRRAKTAPETLEDQDFYAIVPAYPKVGNRRVWGYGLVLEGRGKTRFAKAIDDGPKHQLWEVEDLVPGSNEVKFTLDMEDGLILEKVFRYRGISRDLELDINLVHRGKLVNAPTAYQLRLRGVQVWNPVRARVFQNPAAAVGAIDGADGTPVFTYLAAASCNNIVLGSTGAAGLFSFAGTTSRFFGGILFPADAATASVVSGVTATNWPRREIRIAATVDGEPDVYKIMPLSGPEIRCDLTLAVPALGETTSLRFRVYLGPKSSSIFEDEYARFVPVMEGDLDPANSGCCCPIPGVLELAKFITWVLKGLYYLVGNWGFAIMLLTLVVRILLSPLNFNMQRTMRAHGAKMAELKPKIDAIQKQHKDDPKQLQMEMMKFNKEHKLLSAPLKGCLPILVTMPIWFGMFTALRVMYELRHEGFFGWIDDLSTPDRLFPTGIDWTPVAHFNLLPIIMVSLWIYLQLGTPLPKDPQQPQMMTMMRFMPIMMGVMLYNYAAGLMIYMCTSSIWGIVEQRVTKRLLGPVNPDASTMGSMPMM